MVRPFRAQSALWMGTQGVALGARNAPLGLNTTAHPYCTGRVFTVSQLFSQLAPKELPQFSHSTWPSVKLKLLPKLCRP